MNWIVLSVFAGLFWGLSDVLTRVLSGKVHAVVGSLLASLGMLLFFGLYSAFLRATVGGVSLPEPKVLLGLLLAGAVNGIGWYFFFRLFQYSGSSFTQAMPIILGVVLMVATLAGVFYFGDPFTWRIALGIFFGFVTIYLLAF